MTAFYALTFSMETKKKLSEYRDVIAEHSVKGTFVELDNFHLTLEFIGEISERELDFYKQLLKELQCAPMTIETASISSFKRRNKELVWLDIKRNWDLMRLQQKLRGLLVDNGITVDRRHYEPHLTMGRRIVRLESMDNIVLESLKIPIISIVLMESKEVKGRMVYEPLEEIVF